MSASTGWRTTKANGYTAGADVLWTLTRFAGLGALVRFARAKTTLTADGVGDVAIKAGGLQVGVGPRFVF